MVITGGKMGTVYVVDRRNGKLIWKRNVGRHNQWGDPARDLPTAAEDLPVTMYPGVAGGVETPMSVSGNSIFVPVSDLCATVVSVTTIVSCPYQTGTGASWPSVAAPKDALEDPIPTLPDGATTVVGDVVMAPGWTGPLYSLRASDGEIPRPPKAITGVNAPPAVSWPNRLHRCRSGPRPGGPGLATALSGAIGRPGTPGPRDFNFWRPGQPWRRGTMAGSSSRSPDFLSCPIR